MKFKKKIIEDKDIEESKEIKELIQLAKKIDAPQYSESFWKIQYNKLYQEWEKKKSAYRVKRFLVKSSALALVIALSIFSARFFILGKTHNKTILYKSISKSQVWEIPYSHTLGISYSAKQTFSLKDFVNFFNYAPVDVQKSIINDVLKTE